LKRIPVCALSELPPGERTFVDYGRTHKIGVLNVNGEIVAILNFCPHHGAPICIGEVSGTFVDSDPQQLTYGREGTVLTCPWHHWQFDLKTGRGIADERQRLKKFNVTVEDDYVYIDA
jgi:nitrite reductase/ring-hydroxylating ferredoxin subunit